MRSYQAVFVQVFLGPSRAGKASGTKSVIPNGPGHVTFALQYSPESALTRPHNRTVFLEQSLHEVMVQEIASVVNVPEL